MWVCFLLRYWVYRVVFLWSCALTSHMPLDIDIASENPLILVFFYSLCGAVESCMCVGCHSLCILHQVTSFPVKNLCTEFSNSVLKGEFLTETEHWSESHHSWAGCQRVLIFSSLPPNTQAFARTSLFAKGGTCCFTI